MNDMSTTKHPILSICIPTYNRADILLYTLDCFKYQVLRHSNEVELIICNNASTDDTSEKLQMYHNSNPFFSIKEYDIHENGANVIIRPIENVNGEFFLIFGDDDIPAPYLVDTILDTISRYPNIGIIAYNRLKGLHKTYDSIDDMTIGGQVNIKSLEVLFPNISLYAQTHQREVGFISISVIRTSAWREHYKEVFPNDHFGYQWLITYLYSVKDYPCIYLNYPLCIQRIPSHAEGDPKRSWNDRTELYMLIGRSRAIMAQEKFGIINNGKTLCSKRITSMYSLPRFFEAVDKMFRQNKSQTNLYAKELNDYIENKNYIEIINQLSQQNEIRTKFWRMYYRVQFYGIKSIFNKILK